MVRNILIGGLLVLFSLYSPALYSPVMAQALEGDVSVRQLLAEKWQIVDRQEKFTELPSVSPYEDLKRTLLVTTFLMEKNTAQYRCVLTYDSQVESFDEVCLSIE